MPCAPASAAICASSVGPIAAAWITRSIGGLLASRRRPEGLRGRTSCARLDASRTFLGAFAGLCNVRRGGERHAHSPPLVGFGLAEESQLRAGNGERMGDVLEADAARFDTTVDHRRSPGRVEPHVDGQPENRARMEVEFALRLRAHRDHPRVVRAWAHFGKPHLVALDEKLDAEDAAAAEIGGHPTGDVVRAGNRRRGHRLWLPRLHVVAMRLHMTDRLAKKGPDGAGFVRRANREQGDLVVESDEAFDDYAAATHPARAFRVLPCRGDLGLRAYQRLTFARGGHHGLHNAWIAD